MYELTNQERQLQSFNNVKRIIEEIVRLKKHHNQSEFHSQNNNISNENLCCTAHCIAGWLEINELSKRDIVGSYIELNGDYYWCNETIEESKTHNKIKELLEDGEEELAFKLASENFLDYSPVLNEFEESEISKYYQMCSVEMRERGLNTGGINHVNWQYATWLLNIDLEDSINIFEYKLHILEIAENLNELIEKYNVNTTLLDTEELEKIYYNEV